MQIRSIRRIKDTHLCRSILECELVVGTYPREGIMAKRSVKPVNRPNTMAAPTNAAKLKKALANSEPSHMALFGHARFCLSPICASKQNFVDELPIAVAEPAESRFDHPVVSAALERGIAFRTSQIITAPSETEADQRV